MLKVRVKLRKIGKLLEDAIEETEELIGSIFPKGELHAYITAMSVNLIDAYNWLAQCEGFLEGERNSGGEDDVKA